MVKCIRTHLLESCNAHQSMHDLNKLLRFGGFGVRHRWRMHNRAKGLGSGG